MKNGNMERFSRTENLIGAENLNRLKNACVAVFGIGGVGSFTAEALARAGVGSIDLYDKDTVQATNLNRQLIALESTVGLPKVQVMKERILQINPEAQVGAYEVFYTAENADAFDLGKYDYIADAIDTVSSKLVLIEKAAEKGVRIISSMGTGNKLDPAKFEVSDISRTSVCPLARVMRHELKKRGINKLKVVYSAEQPLESRNSIRENGKQIPASISFVPSAAGLILAGAVVRDLIEME